MMRERSDVTSWYFDAGRRNWFQIEVAVMGNGEPERRGTNQGERSTPGHDTGAQLTTLPPLSPCRINRVFAPTIVDHRTSIPPCQRAR
jgi:hypothetical protein